MKLRSLSFGTAVAAAAVTAGVMLTFSAAGNAQVAAPTPTTAPSVVVATPQPAHSGDRALMQQLNLSPTQKQAIKGLLKSQKSQVDAIKANTALTPLQVRQQTRQVRESTMAQIRGNLNATQQQQWDAFLAQRKAERQAARTAGQQ